MNDLGMETKTREGSWLQGETTLKPLSDPGILLSLSSLSRLRCLLNESSTELVWVTRRDRDIVVTLPSSPCTFRRSWSFPLGRSRTFSHAGFSYNAHRHESYTGSNIGIYIYYTALCDTFSKSSRNEARLSNSLGNFPSYS